ncbi:Snf7-domain-containing protein [Punctularia strigosozonata HHB-11173 SS5]|uniref:Snf7-domain-containing protein n=1 Tax=Punctularia strigosozonata (strain HHB-11173) TaxID=741275 RepID=UPI0004417294|nr:Snf7-domain-containing protein [Punctularia strigosozonata HHB-11173 SS5]EIN10916.1 Snf7-domain-containing protein [Punctularia strigosozonata HHB-11173 SS5]
MMASFMSYFGGRRDPKQSARDAIVTLRQQLQMLEKKEEYLQKKINEEVAKAKANATTNKTAATNALRRKKVHEQEMDRLQGTRMQLEMQVNTLESANMNAETMAALKKGADALKHIHGNMTLDKVDATMSSIQEQTQVANEISEAISNPMYGAGDQIDEDELKAELAELEQEELNDRLMGADHVPIHAPAGPSKVQSSSARVAEEDDEEAQLKALQAELAM